MALVERTTLTPENIDHTKLTVEAGVAGLLATSAATALMVAAPTVGLPRVDGPWLLARAMVGDAPDWTFARLMAWVMYLAGGSMLAIAWARGVARQNPRSGTVSGLMSAVAPWILMQTVVLPLSGHGVFGLHTAHPVGQALVTLVGALLYGALVGGLVHRQVVRNALPVIEYRATIVQ
jgi:hypothetical protein